MLAECLSSKADLTFGVPQGSGLGPLFFTLYTTPLSHMISGHAIPHRLHADDSQLYVSFDFLLFIVILLERARSLDLHFSRVTDTSDNLFIRVQFMTLSLVPSDV